MEDNRALLFFGRLEPEGKRKWISAFEIADLFANDGTFAVELQRLADAPFHLFWRFGETREKFPAYIRRFVFRDLFKRKRGRDAFHRVPIFPRRNQGRRGICPYRRQPFPEP